jgi:hypothetical protein
VEEVVAAVPKVNMMIVVSQLIVVVVVVEQLLFVDIVLLKWVHQHPLQ